MIGKILVPALAASLAFFAVVPTAEAGPVSCGVSTAFWITTAHCTVDGFGLAGATLLTCPPDTHCSSNTRCTIEADPAAFGCE